MQNSAYSLRVQKHFNQFIHRFSLISSSSTEVMVSLSGGRDSVALLFLLKNYLSSNKFISLKAVHFNHGIREESRQEEAFVVMLCRRLAIPLEVVPLDFLSTSNFEQVAREKRLNYFHKRLSKDLTVAQGHHLNDSFEWYLMQTLKSGNPHILGIPVRRGPFIRPLMCLTRKQITAYLKNLGQTWCEDDSNQNLHYERNWVRHCLIPMIHQRYPQAMAHYLHRVQALALKKHSSIASNSSPWIWPASNEKSRIDLIPQIAQTIDQMGSKKRGRYRKELIKLMKSRGNFPRGPHRVTNELRLKIYPECVVLYQIPLLSDKIQTT